MDGSTIPVVLVSGASSEVGAACTRHLSEANHEVFEFARGSIASNRWLQGLLLEEEPGLAEERLAEFVVEQIWNREGRIHAVVNCLDYGLAGAIEETTVQEARALFEANVFDMIRIGRTVLPLMRQQGSGLIINVGLARHAVPQAFQGVYTASRQAMEALSSTLCAEVETFGVDVALIRAGSSAATGDMPVARQARRKTSAYKERFERRRSHATHERPDESPQATVLLIEGLIREHMERISDGSQQQRSPRRFTSVGPAGPNRSRIDADALRPSRPSSPPIATFAGTWSGRDKQTVEEAVLSFEMARLQQGAAGPECWTCTRRNLRDESIYVAYRGGEVGPLTARSSDELADLILQKRAAEHSDSRKTRRHSTP